MLRLTTPRVVRRVSFSPDVQVHQSPEDALRERLLQVVRDNKGKSKEEIQEMLAAVARQKGVGKGKTCTQPLALPSPSGATEPVALEMTSSSGEGGESSASDGDEPVTEFAERGGCKFKKLGHIEPAALDKLLVTPVRQVGQNMVEEALKKEKKSRDEDQEVLQEAPKKEEKKKRRKETEMVEEEPAREEELWWGEDQQAFEEAPKKEKKKKRRDEEQEVLEEAPKKEKKKRDEDQEVLEEASKKDKKKRRDEDQEALEEAPKKEKKKRREEVQGMVGEELQREKKRTPEKDQESAGDQDGAEEASSMDIRDLPTVVNCPKFEGRPYEQPGRTLKEITELNKQRRENEKQLRLHDLKAVQVTKRTSPRESALSGAEAKRTGHD